MPGGTVSSSAEIRSTPRSMQQLAEPLLHARPVALHLLLRPDLLAPQALCRPGVGSPSSSADSDSDRLCAGSVEITSVRSPAAAQRRAVQAATDVLPTPPLPVYRIVRGLMARRVYSARGAGAGSDQRGSICSEPAIRAKFPARSVAASAIA